MGKSEQWRGGDRIKLKMNQIKAHAYPFSITYKLQIAKKQ